AAEAAEKGASELVADGGLSPETAENFVSALSAFDPYAELESARRAGVRVLTADDEDFPELLRRIYDPPLALYVKGGPAAEAVPVGVVGTRKPTAYGARSSARLARELSAAGVTVVSGLARGVDTLSHEAAVKSGGTTWAVLGSGLNFIYPRENRKLSENITGSGGAVFSEFPMNSGPRPANFPRRNRIISGLSYAVVVVEGDFRSGSLITARAALEQGREVLAMPGPADSEMSRGPNMLIKNGAAVAEGAADVLAALPAEAISALKPSGLPRGTGKGPAAGLRGLSPDARAAYGAVSGAESGLDMDALVRVLGWPVQRAAAAVFELESEAFLTQRAGRYVPTV
ncbi:MAG TPA: DNA-processing protein DprA, partial [Elusimicrobiales bacterium]|nr:DNA-processing protein DprA [Elusimicrobiales bacterium]